MADDYYTILGVDRGASSEVIQKAYRKLARQHHPDLADDKEAAKAKFQKIQHAYDVLSDPQKRQLYDQLGPQFEQASAAGQHPYRRGGTSHEMQMDLEQLFGRGGGGGGFEEILKQVFGGAARGGTGAGSPFGHGGPPPPARGRDIEQEITIPFSTAVLGGKHQISLERGSGKIESITLTIPAGIENGKKVRLRGQGQSSPNGGAKGDLLVKVKVANHPVYQRIGKNLQVTVPISVAEAACGAKIDLPTPHGKVTLTVPPGSSSGKMLRLKGMGIKPKTGSAGDLIAELRIALPANLTDQQRELLKKLDSMSDDNLRAKLNW